MNMNKKCGVLCICGNPSYIAPVNVNIKYPFQNDTSIVTGYFDSARGGLIPLAIPADKGKFRIVTRLV